MSGEMLRGEKRSYRSLRDMLIQLRFAVENKAYAGRLFFGFCVVQNGDGDLRFVGLSPLEPTEFIEHMQLVSEEYDIKVAMCSGYGVDGRVEHHAAFFDYQVANEALDYAKALLEEGDIQPATCAEGLAAVASQKTH